MSDPARRPALVTGAGGFIGGHLARGLKQAGFPVRGMVRRENEAAARLREDGVELVLADLEDPASLARALEGVGVVVHAAGVVSDWGPADLFQRVQVDSMDVLCRLAREAGVERFVYLSTNDVFGLREDRVITEDLPYAAWQEPYPDTKKAASEIAWSHHEQGLPVTMLYPCWVYGPGDHSLVPILAEALADGMMFQWRRDALVWPCYVGNLVDLVVAVAEHPAAVGEGFLVHDGASETLEQFCHRIAAGLDLKPRVPYIPMPVARVLGRLNEALWRLLRRQDRPPLTTYAVKNLGSRLRFSIEKADRLLGWRPRHAYPAALQRTLADDPPPVR